MLPDSASLKRTSMKSIVRYAPGPRYSRIVVHSGIAYFSGLTADEFSGDIHAQTSETLAKADAYLAKVGATRSDILSAMVWLSDIGEFAGMNEIWEAWIDTDHPPARATVESRLALPGIKVEIQFTVAAGTSDPSLLALILKE